MKKHLYLNNKLASGLQSDSKVLEYRAKGWAYLIVGISAIQYLGILKLQIAIKQQIQDIGKNALIRDRRALGPTGKQIDLGNSKLK